MAQGKSLFKKASIFIWALTSLWLPKLNAAAAAPGLWLSAAYTYTDHAYKESKLTEKGKLSGAQGELGLGLMGTLAISAAGEYISGDPTFVGDTLDEKTVNARSNDYMRDLRLLAHFYLGQFVLSGGVGRRYWSADIENSYRQNTQYDYYPVMLTYTRRPFYIRFENDFWKGGKNTTFMSDVSSTRDDVRFNKIKGTGYGAEVGVIIPTAVGIDTRVFVSYHKWDIKESEDQSDGVANLSVPSNDTTTLQFGIGLIF
jgi:hypothetical protein